MDGVAIAVSKVVASGGPEMGTTDDGRAIDEGIADVGIWIEEGSCTTEGTATDDGDNAGSDVWIAGGDSKDGVGNNEGTFTDDKIAMGEADAIEGGWLARDIG